MNNLRLLTGLLVVVTLSMWKNAYGQVVTLKQIFEAAETNSLQLRPYITAQEEAKKEVDISRSNRLPDIQTSMSVSYIGDGFTTDRSFSDYTKATIPHFGNNLSININQPLYTGGRITNGIEIAELKSTASRFTTEIQRDNLRLRLTGYYLDIYKCRNLQKVLENNIRQAKMVLREMKSRYEQGVALRNDITRYELLVSNLELSLIKIRNTIDILNNDLVTTAGLPASTIIEPDTTILDKAIPSLSEANWLQEAEHNSPTLMLAHTGLKISQRAESIARAETLPKIGLQAGWNIDGPILTEVPPINRNLSYWYVGIGVSYNLSSLYKSNKSIAKTKIATRKAEEELEAIQENIAITLKSDYIRYLEAYEDLKTQKKSVELAERNYQTTLTRYSAEMALITDMLDAANSKLDSEQNLVNARINILYQYYKLLFISGKI